MMNDEQNVAENYATAKFGADCTAAILKKRPKLQKIDDT